ncbi:MAG TPA: RNA polymerase sigma factor [Cyclobacteriaceae bacterium]|nr:RNA polymerase sigma factor [Cyclobacteriaceae bacterium]
MPELQSLYERCKNGEPKAQRELYELFKNRLMGLCRRYTHTREEAEDVLQETFIKIFAKFHQVASADKTEGWMKSVAVRTAIDHYHKSKKEKHLYEPGDATVLSVAAVSIDKASDEYLVNLINNLPGKCRMVFNLFEVEGYSHTEIAAIMDITESTSRSQLHYAKSLLKEKLRGTERPNYYERLARG